MVESNFPQPSSGILNYDGFSFSEKVIYWVGVLTPVWWLLGIQPLFYPAVLISLLFINFRLYKLTRYSFPFCIWAWFFMALVMLWTATLGINSVGFSFRFVAANIVTFGKSYFLIFACLILPFWSQVRLVVITRSVVWLSIGLLGNVMIQLLLLAVGIKDAEYIPPLARLIPDAGGSLVVRSAKIDPFFGIPLPRSILHTADPPILGICSLLCLIICLGEENQRLRFLGLCGALSGLIISFSRSSWLGLPLTFLIIAYFGSFLARQISLQLTFITALLSSFLGLTLQQLVAKPLNIFESARTDSSITRSLVVQETLEAWQEMPWLGWGIIRGEVWLFEDKYITLGSFSTYAAILYLHGIIGFMVFLIALGSTITFFYRSAMLGNLYCQRAFATLVTLALFIHSTPLSWMAVYLWFFFVWLGAIMVEIHQEEYQKFISRWEQLSLHIPPN